MEQEDHAIYRGNVQRSGEYEAAGVPDLHGIAWQFQTGVPVDLTPVIASGRVLFSSTNRTFYALDALTGKRQWHLQMSGKILDPPDVATDIVYVSDGSIHALNLQTGQHLWTWNTSNLPPKEKLWELHGSSSIDEYALDKMLNAGDEEEDGGEGFGGPTYYKERLYLLFSDTIAMALDLVTREPVWWTCVGGGASSPMAIDDGLVHFTAFYSQNDDVLHGLDSQTGSFTAPAEDMLHAAEGLIYNPRAFAFRDHVLYTIGSSESGELSSRGIMTQEVHWVTALPYAEGLAVGQGMVYVTTGPDQRGRKPQRPAVIACDRENGQIVWQISDLTAAPSRIRFPTLAGSVLYLILDDQFCCALDAATGRERWRVQLEKGILAPPSIAGRMIFVAAGQSVYALH